MHLRCAGASYVMQVLDGRFLTHLYWGAALPDPVSPSAEELMSPVAAPYLAVTGGDGSRSSGYSLDTLPQEYPVWGTGEQREGALALVLADGTPQVRLEYAEHELISAAVLPEGLPGLRPDHAFGAVETLRVRLADPRGDLRVDLFYVVADAAPAILRWTRLTNTGSPSSAAIRVQRIMSASWDQPAGHYDLLRLAGAWARERHPVRTAVGPGGLRIGTGSGASSHQTSPFVAVCEPETDEHRGEVRAASLLYSGNFEAGCSMDQYQALRTSIGLGAYRGHLAPGTHLDTPVAALVYSGAGLNGMSQAYHRLLRDGIVAERWRREARRTVINSWEAMYFNLSAERVVALARAGREIGAELLVLDDGWFSGRRDDTSSLGDWWTNRELFPDGLGALAELVRAEGLEFGLWMEPEMVSPDSELCRSHPDWFLQISGREPTLARNQLTLDLANPAVVDYLTQVISDVLEESGATYVKWDMNRAMSEAGSLSLPPERQGEVMHRYMLGLYELLERVTRRFPAVLFEGCAGGGGRFDMGLAAWSPRFWTSDQTDAIERLDVQYGSSLIFPPEMMGAHVSSVPNHMTHRSAPALTRVRVAACFSFGFELNPENEPEEDRAVFRSGAELYRSVRDLCRSGRFHRLGSASGGAGAVTPAAVRDGGGGRQDIAGDHGGTRAWMVEADAGSELLVVHVAPLLRTNTLPRYLRLSGITAPDETIYRDRASGQRYSAALLRSRGLQVHPAEDFHATLWHLERERT